MALGCDYPTAHMIISESIPSTSRGKLVLAAFAFQAVGALGGTGVGYFVLLADPDASMPGAGCTRTAIIPALIVTIGRFFITESADWLHIRGAIERAEAAAQRLLLRKPQYPGSITLARDAAVAADRPRRRQASAALFNARNRRATIFASVPWFLQDLGTYGIGIFTPTILAAALGNKPDHVRSVSDLILNDILAAKGAAMITTLLIVGIIFAVILADRVGPHLAAGDRLHRLRRRPADRLVGRRLRRRHPDRGDLRRLHAVQLHDQPRPERADLPAGRRSVPDRNPRHRRGLRGGGRQDRRGRHGLPVPDPAGRHRHQPRCSTSWSARRCSARVVTWVFRIETNGVNLEEIGR